MMRMPPSFCLVTGLHPGFLHCVPYFPMRNCDPSGESLPSPLASAHSALNDESNPRILARVLKVSFDTLFSYSRILFLSLDHAESFMFASPFQIPVPLVKSGTIVFLKTVDMYSGKNCIKFLT
ncbi:hypothetical protein NY2A_b514L [Paramecium bursaria Chlorella virus NY2A]|uniref:Uncharacterized protein b514L n=1 Tax=Paramecium bursaria Chlorella virus NY2A TaxID=46021 RepID=A7IX39_PBCVN|nr:hypothetical protein NY2A_b514L [Paramecium bursaria Chlorella virus NY2A]ABT14913.1 hypothetical protein NY2A_b514L [Paramecium bursaria Chlorella virus NY2A]